MSRYCKSSKRSSASFLLKLSAAALGMMIGIGGSWWYVDHRATRARMQKSHDNYEIESARIRFGER